MWTFFTVTEISQSLCSNREQEPQIVLNFLHCVPDSPPPAPFQTLPLTRDYVALAKGFPALALISEGDLERDFAPFAEALGAALDPIVTDFRRQMVITFPP